MDSKRAKYGGIVVAAALFLAFPCAAKDPAEGISQDAARAKRDAVAVHTQPWAMLWMSGIERMISSFDAIYRAAERPELAETLEERFSDYRAFSGINRKRPVGLMWTWDEVNPAAYIFLPIDDINELLKTATFDVVDFHQVAPDQFEIERPGTPYHVVVRSGYALFGEDVGAIKAIRQSPDQLTRSFRDKYDVVGSVDLRQIPRESKTLWVETLQNYVEPWLQQQDGEPNQTANLRLAVGRSLISAAKRIVFDVNSIIVGGRFDSQKREISLDLMIDCESRSELAGIFNRLVTRRSEFSSLVNDKATVGLAINWPLNAIVTGGITGIPDEIAKGLRIDAGLQIVGSGWGDSCVIIGMRGPEAAAINATIPKLLLQLESSMRFRDVQENIEIHRGVVLHSMKPVEVPEALRQLSGDDIEFRIGQGKQIVWFAAGSPVTLPGRLMQAIDAVENQPDVERSKALVQGRIAVGAWRSLESVPQPSPESAIPPVLPAQKESSEFRLSVEPANDGLRIRFVGDEAILRMIGKEWARQIDDARASEN